METVSISDLESCNLIGWNLAQVAMVLLPRNATPIHTHTPYMYVHWQGFIQDLGGRERSLWGTTTASCMSMRLYKFSSFLGGGEKIEAEGEFRAPHPCMKPWLPSTLWFFSQTKIHSYSDRYGSNPDDWPMMQSVITSSDVAGSSSSGAGSDPVDGSEESRDHYHKWGSKPHPRGLNSPTALEESGRDHWIIRDDSRASSLEASSCGTREHHMEVSWQVYMCLYYSGTSLIRTPLGLYNQDTLEMEESVLVSEVSWFQGSAKESVLISEVS